MNLVVHGRRNKMATARIKKEINLKQENKTKRKQI